MLISGLPFILAKRRYAISAGAEALGHASNFIICLQSSALA